MEDGTPNENNGENINNEMSEKEKKKKKKKHKHKKRKGSDSEEEDKKTIDKKKSIHSKRFNSRLFCSSTCHRKRFFWTHIYII